MDAGKPRLVGVEVELDLRRFWGDSRRSWGRPRTAGRRGGPGHRAPGVLFRGFQLSPFPSSGSARSSCLETISKLQPGAALGRAPRAPGAARAGPGRIYPAGVSGRKRRRDVLRANRPSSARSASMKARRNSPSQARAPVERMARFGRSNERRSGRGDGFLHDAGACRTLVCFESWEVAWKSWPGSSRMME